MRCSVRCVCMHCSVYTRCERIAKGNVECHHDTTQARGGSDSDGGGHASSYHLKAVGFHACEASGTDDVSLCGVLLSDRVSFYAVWHEDSHTGTQFVSGATI